MTENNAWTRFKTFLVADDNPEIIFGIRKGDAEVLDQWIRRDERKRLLKRARKQLRNIDTFSEEHLLHLYLISWLIDRKDE